MRTLTGSVIGRLIQFFEYRAASLPRLNRLYGKLFYQRLVAREIELAGIAPGAEVLHIGCGPAPYTAQFLASAGMQVTAVERDVRAFKAAAGIIKKSGNKDHIRILNRDGLDIDVKGFEAIWLSLHVEPKAELVRKLYSRMLPATVLIYRNPRSWLRLFYLADKLWSTQAIRKNIFAKESVRICKPSLQQPVSLSCLRYGDYGTIVEAPQMPLLSSLGYRPGKQIRVKHQGLCNGPLIVEIDGRNSALALPVAALIKVQPAA